MEKDLDIIIKGINKGSFCRATTKNSRFVSLAHFVTLQSMECIKLTESYMPDGYADGSRIFIWLPTPDKSREQQAEYVTVARSLITRLIAEVPNPTEVVIDLRCNIGGVLSTFINAILPFIIGGIAKLPNGIYMHGRDNSNREIAKFYITNATNILQHIIDVEGDLIVTELMPAEPLKCMNFSILCNRYTMSSGEILCMVFRYLAEQGNFACKLYGEKTRGLTNGCVEKSIGDAKVMVPIYYLCCGKREYRNGVDGMLPLSKIKL